MPLPTRRLLGSVLATTLLAGVFAGPVSAGATAIYVDDDGQTGTAGCNGTSVQHASIQEAVDGAGAGTTIRLCPGTYPERVRIATGGLTLEAVDPGTAVLTSVISITKAGAGPAGGEPSTPAALIWVDGADNVLITGIRFVAQTPDIDVAPESCALDAMVAVSHDANGVRVVANRMQASGPASLGPCGFQSGVSFADGSSGRAVGNLVWNFRGEAISAWGVGTTLKVAANEIRFWHKNATIDPGPTGGSPFSCTYGAGILFANGAVGRAVDNVIPGLATAGYTTPLICPAIYLDGAGEGIQVLRNRAANAFDGINTAGTNGWTVSDNRFIASRNDGLLVINSRRSLAERNTVRGSQGRGIAVPSESRTAGSGYGQPSVSGFQSSGNITFRGNSSTDNTRRDCVDSTTGSRTKGTANTWVGNHSDGNDSPNGICPR